ncbi:MAG: Abi family protein [Campylobacterota bacterium]|nr:Abi family protein [Campylobacterota bacterium]
MNQKLYEQLELSISKNRLDEYSKILNTDKTKTIFTYYILNSELSKSLYIPLQNLEVTLRNNIHNALTEFYKTERWYELDDVLDYNELKRIDESKTKLKRLKKELTPSRIISELSFGFWTSLFNKYYEQKIWAKHGKSIFPNIPKKYKNRKYLSTTLNSIRYFRNRIFHFEPIFKSSNLQDVHIDILTLIKWLNIALYEVTVEFDEFNDICKNETKNTIKKLNKINQNYN